MSGVACLTYRAVDLAFRGLDRSAGHHPGSPLHAAKKKPAIRIGSDTAQSGVVCSTWFLGEGSGGSPRQRAMFEGEQTPGRRQA